MQQGKLLLVGIGQGRSPLIVGIGLISRVLAQREKMVKIAVETGSKMVEASMGTDPNLSLNL
jgi:hypothetical protein